MRIGLLSDTHIPDVERALPPEVFQALRGVDLILHAGDIYIVRVLDELERIAPVLAAEGDDDYGDTLTDKRVKRRHVLTLMGHTLWLVHERPYFHKVASPLSTKALAQDEHDPPDIVVFGHEHRAMVQRSENALLVNPGSPTLLNYRRGLGTVAILTIGAGEADVVVLQLTTGNQSTTLVPQASTSSQHSGAKRRAMTADELMQMPDDELELMVAERVMVWKPAPEGAHAPDGDPSGYQCKQGNGDWRSHKAFCSDASASLELDRVMQKLGWRYELHPAQVSFDGFWGYGITYSSEGYWVGVAVESPAQIRKAKCAAAILAIEGQGE